jgi:hypothetical protein
VWAKLSTAIQAKHTKHTSTPSGHQIYTQCQNKIAWSLHCKLSSAKLDLNHPLPPHHDGMAVDNKSNQLARFAFLFLCLLTPPPPFGRSCILYFIPQIPPLPRDIPPPRPGQAYHVFEATFTGIMGSTEHQAYLRMLDARKGGVIGFNTFPTFPERGNGVRR